MRHVRATAHRPENHRNDSVRRCDNTFSITNPELLASCESLDPYLMNGSCFVIADGTIKFDPKLFGPFDHVAMGKTCFTRSQKIVTR